MAALAAPGIYHHVASFWVCLGNSIHGNSVSLELFHDRVQLAQSSFQNVETPQ
jgi:hypothetical protein